MGGFGYGSAGVGFEKLPEGIPSPFGLEIRGVKLSLHQQSKLKSRFFQRLRFAPRVGFEPTTWGLTGPRATIAPPRNGILYILRIS